MLDARSLRWFIVLAEERHFGRTAERLGIAQSALSNGLRRLEDSLGALLVNRGKRAVVTLTKTGVIFLTEAREALARLDQAERVGRLSAKGQAGPLRVGYVFSAAMSGVLPRMLAALRDAYPLLVVTPVLMETPEQLLAVADGSLDLGLVRPRPAAPDGLVLRTIHEEDLVIALRNTNPLADQAAIAPSALAHATFILPQFHESVGLIDNVRRLAEAGGFSGERVHHTADFATALTLAAGGYGVVLAPRSLTNLRLEGVVFRPLDDYADHVALAVCYRANDEARLKSVLELLQGNDGDQT